MLSNVSICRGGRGIVLPLTNAELDWHDNVRAILYGIGLVWCFLGVAIVADTFMGSIEAITSRRKQVKARGSSKMITVRVWNDSVANLTLMALGSSAPEILLSVIELFKREMYAGELGPSTIVGSASFNLMMIIGLCVAVIPDGESRKIKALNVFYITTVFSLVAYFWLVFIISYSSPEIVDPWEAVFTFMLFPVLVWAAYAADVGILSRLSEAILQRHREKSPWASAQEVPEEVISRACKILADHEPETMSFVQQVIWEHPALGDLSDPTLSDIQDLWEFVNEARARKFNSNTRASRRQEATRWLTAGRRSRTSKQLNAFNNPIDGDMNCVRFASTKHALSANVPNKQLTVFRHGDRSVALDVDYSVHLCPPKGSSTPGHAPRTESFDDVNRLPSQNTANTGLGSMGSVPGPLGPLVTTGSISFEVDEAHKDMDVTAPQDEFGESVSFEVRLMKVSAVNPTGESLKRRPSRSSGHTRDSSTSATSVQTWTIGTVCFTKVHIVPPELRGKLAFSSERIRVQGTSLKQEVEVLVLRKDGCAGLVSCSYRTERLSAVPGYDYEDIQGSLTFEEGVTEQRISVTILPKKMFEKTDEFLLVLEEAEGGACFDARHDGGSESSILTVTIMAQADDRFTMKAFRLLDDLVNFDEVRLGTNHWREQVNSAIYCNGGAEEQAEATKFDWFFHLISLPWKVLFSLVPPTSYCSGWACFWMALVMIALVTVVIEDLAELFGCVLDVPDAVTAITFVALGTSMPDLFASKSAATQDPTADASICNVTGSNSVNVFLGLGIPSSATTTPTMMRR